MKRFLKETQVDKLSDISADIAQVCLASIVIPFLVDKYKPLLVIWGLSVSLVFWGISLLLLRSKE